VKNKIEKIYVKEKINYTHKTVFTWFGNLLASTELHRFHYYQGKIQNAAVQFFFFLTKLQQQTLITKATFSTSYVQDSQWATKWAKKFSAQVVVPWTKSQKISH